MRAWIGCLASYNAGRLIGEWVEVSTDADENAETIARILKDSPEPLAEEYYVADYDDDHGLRRLLGEYPSASDLAFAAEFVSDAEDEALNNASPAIEAYLDVNSPQKASDLYPFKDWWRDAYAGEANSLTDWITDHLEETGELDAIPSHLRDYFDFRSYARDMQSSGEVFTVDSPTGVIVFWSR